MKSDSSCLWIVIQDGILCKKTFTFIVQYSNVIENSDWKRICTLTKDHVILGFILSQHYATRKIEEEYEEE